MHHRPIMPLVAVISLLVLPLVWGQAPSAKPSLSLSRPLGSQRIPVARLGRAFSFTFAPDTVTSLDGSPVVYTAFGTPSWMTFAGRTFSGTPARAQDLGVYETRVVASSAPDDASAALEDILTFISVADAAPYVSTPLSAQLVAGSPALASVTPYEPWSARYPGVRVSRGWSFSIGLAPATFVDPEGYSVVYDLRLKDGSALPDWLQWDAPTLTLSGVATVFPNASAIDTPPGLDIYELILGGSDRAGYWDVEQAFTIGVQDYDFQVGPGGIGLNVSAGYPMWPVDFSDLGDALTFRNVSEEYETWHRGNISVYPGSVSWLEYDAASGTFVGAAPVTTIGELNLSLVLGVTDPWGNTVVTPVPVQVFPWAFTNEQLPDSRLDANGSIALPIAQYLSNRTAEVEIYCVADINALWLEYANGTVSGTQPGKTRYSEAKITLVATDWVTRAKSWATLKVDLTIPDVPPPPPPPAAMATARGLSRSGKIALGVTLGLLALLFLLSGFVLLIKRREHHNAQRRVSSGFWNFADARSEDEQEVSVLPYNQYERDSAFDGRSDKGVSGGPIHAERLRVRFAEFGRRASSYFSRTPRASYASTQPGRYISDPFALSPSPNPGIGIGHPPERALFRTDAWYDGQALSSILEVSEPPTMRAVRPSEQGRLHRAQSLPNTFGSSLAFGTDSDSIVSLYTDHQDPWGVGAAEATHFAEPIRANWGAMGRAVVEAMPPSDSDGSRYADPVASSGDHRAGMSSDEAASPPEGLGEWVTYAQAPLARNGQGTGISVPAPYRPVTSDATRPFPTRRRDSSDSSSSSDSEPSTFVHARRIAVPPTAALARAPSMPALRSASASAGPVPGPPRRSSRGGRNPTTPTRQRLVSDMRLVI